MRIAVASLVTLLILGPAFAAASEFSVAAAPNGSIDIEVVFTDEEIHIIRAHYQSHGGHHAKGNGKHKRKGLPPGIAKNLARGKPLPPGIAKQVLPYGLRRALPPVKDGYERIIVDGKILLVEIATQVVHDVLTDIVFNVAFSCDGDDPVADETPGYLASADNPAQVVANEQAIVNF